MNSQFISIFHSDQSPVISILWGGNVHLSAIAWSAVVEVVHPVLLKPVDRGSVLSDSINAVHDNISKISTL